MSSLPEIVSSLEENSGDTAAKTTIASSTVHWIISWDINETILVGDEVGGDTREDCFNKIIAKSAFVRMPADSANDYDNTSALTPTHWWDDTPLKKDDDGTSKEGTVPPPLFTGWEWPEGCCPYYRTSFKRIAKTFTNHHGAIYRPLYDQIVQQLTTTQQDNSVFRNILPAFFHTVYNLVQQQRDNVGPPPTFVFRTFGTDLPNIAKAMTAFCQGKHPDFPGFVHPEYELDISRLYNAKWVQPQESNDQSKEYFQYQLYRQDDNQLIASGDQQVLDLLHDTSSGHYVHGIRDDYDMWKSHNWEPWAGKPVWKTDDSNHHHMLLDDNIHNLPHDGIASVRRPMSPQPKQNGDIVFESLDGAEIQAMHGLHLIRVPTVEPILNQDWFLQQIEKAQAAAIRARESTR